MIKVITYGTYDLLHYGHIRLLKRAKALGDYLIVGVTSDDFDKTRGKINVQQSLMERIEAIRATGLADEIIVEEYEGQKIDDINRYDVDIFTVGSDWDGKFDYLNEYCKVIYLPRTEGVSSSEIRAKKEPIKLGIIGKNFIASKVARESAYINGLEISGIFPENGSWSSADKKNDFEKLLNCSDAVYIISKPENHYEQIKALIKNGKHVLCEAPIALTQDQTEELHKFAADNNCILMDSIKTAYSTAYSRMLLLVKAGKIGKVVSVDATATSLSEIEFIKKHETNDLWNSITAWGPTALLPVFQLLGTEYKTKKIISKLIDNTFDAFTKIDLVYDEAVATIKVGKAAKSEGELVISGTYGYVYVPAPWWKIDYFEIRYENASENRKYFYPLEGEGIRHELVVFLRAIRTGKNIGYINRNISVAISRMIEDFYRKNDFIELSAKG